MSTRSATSPSEPPCCAAGSWTPATPCSPVRGTGEQRWEPRARIALGRIKLGLDQVEGLGEVGTPDVSDPEVGADRVGQPQVGTSQVSTDQVGTSQAGPAQVGALQVSADQVRPAVVQLVRDLGTHKLARAQQQDVDPISMCRHVQLQQGLRALPG